MGSQSIKLNDKKYENLDDKQKKALEAVLNKLRNNDLEAILMLNVKDEWFIFDLRELPDSPDEIKNPKPTRCGICYYYPLSPLDNIPCTSCCAWWDKKCGTYRPRTVNKCTVCGQNRVTSPQCP